MKRKFIFFFALSILAISTSFAQTFSGLSVAIVTGTGDGRTTTFLNPWTNENREGFTGLLVATVDGNPTQFYCIDLRRTISFPDECHRDSAATLPKIIYILNNYYPFKTSYTGKLEDNDDEAAAVQLAIWHFSDGVNLNTVDPQFIEERAEAIRDAANANGGTTALLTTFKFEPGADPDEFRVRTLDQNGAAIAINNIVLTTTQGSLSPNNVNTTTPTGYSPWVTANDVGNGATITATAMVIFPQGVTYTCSGKQKLVIAKPCKGKMKITTTWGALPVELASFTSLINSRNVTLNWSTSSEVNNSAFNIERKSTTSNDWNSIGSVTGNGTSNISHDYTFTDLNLVSGKYNYRLKQIDFNGNFEYFNLNNEINIGTPSNFDLSQNYPNPFNPTTKINYDLSFNGMVNLNIFDMSGKQVMSVVNEQQPAGYYSVTFNAGNIASGVYYYRLTANGEGKNFVATKKMMLVK